MSVAPDPPAIQPHGVLLVLREPELVVTQASDNLAAHLQLGATDLLGQPLTRLFDPHSVDLVRKALADGRWEIVNPLRLQAGGKHFDGILHRHGGAAILELEPSSLPASAESVHHPAPGVADSPAIRAHSSRAPFDRRRGVAASHGLRAGHVISLRRRGTLRSGRGSEGSRARALPGAALSGVGYSAAGARPVSQELAAHHSGRPRHARARSAASARRHRVAVGSESRRTQECRGRRISSKWPTWVFEHRSPSR